MFRYRGSPWVPFSTILIRGVGVIACLAGLITEIIIHVRSEAVILTYVAFTLNLAIHGADIPAIYFGKWRLPPPAIIVLDFVGLGLAACAFFFVYQWNYTGFTAISAKEYDEDGLKVSMVDALKSECISLLAIDSLLICVGFFACWRWFRARRNGRSNDGYELSS